MLAPQTESLSAGAVCVRATEMMHATRADGRNRKERRASDTLGGMRLARYNTRGTNATISSAAQRYLLVVAEDGHNVHIARLVDAGAGLPACDVLHEDGLIRLQLILQEGGLHVGLSLQEGHNREPDVLVLTLEVPASSGREKARARQSVQPLLQALQIQ